MSSVEYRPFENSEHVPRREKPQRTNWGAKTGQFVAHNILTGVGLALSYGTVPFAKAAVNYLIENPVEIALKTGGLYVAKALYDLWGEAQILNDEEDLEDLSVMTQENLPQEDSVIKFRQNTESVLKRLKMRDPDRYKNAKAHYRTILMLITEKQERAFSWATDQFDVQHQYHLQSEGIEHHARVTKAAARGFVHQHVPGFRVRNFNPKNEEHKFRRSKEREFREEFEIPRTPPQAPRGSSTAEPTKATKSSWMRCPIL